MYDIAFLWSYDSCNWLDLTDQKLKFLASWFATISTFLYFDATFIVSTKLKGWKIWVEVSELASFYNLNLPRQGYREIDQSKQHLRRTRKWEKKKKHRIFRSYHMFINVSKINVSISISTFICNTSQCYTRIWPIKWFWIYGYYYELATEGGNKKDKKKKKVECL